MYNYKIKVMMFNTTFNNISAISWRSVYWRTRRKPPICRKSLTNFCKSCRGVLDTTLCDKVRDLWEVDGFLQILRFPPPIKLTTLTEILLIVALSIITLIPNNLKVFGSKSGYRTNGCYR